MTQYFWETYKIKLNPKQPCLYVNQRDQKIFLPAELCHEASLPENFTKDTFKMRELQGYKITSAEERKKKILKLIQKFMQDDVFDQWGVKVGQGMTELKGKKLAVPLI